MGLVAYFYEQYSKYLCPFLRSSGVSSMIAASIFHIEWEDALREQARQKRERDRKRAWRAANPERDRETARHYRAEHRDRINARMREWIRKNPKKKRAASKRDYEKNKAARRAKADQWKRDHPGYVVPLVRRRRREETVLQLMLNFPTRMPPSENSFTTPRI
jgi:membrane-bound lytic murein transglycosylase